MITARTPALLALSALLTAVGADAWPPPPMPATEVGFPYEFAWRRVEGPLGADGTRLVYGPHRAERRADGWHFADDRVREGFVTVVELAGRITFLTYDGLVLTSDSFTGPLRLVGRCPQAAASSPWTRGRMLMVTATAGAFVTDGVTVTPVGPTSSAVHRGAFLDERTGAAVLDDGSLAITRDGGVSWGAVDLQGDLALSVGFREGALRVVTVRGVATLSAAGVLSPAQPLPPVSVEIPWEPRPAPEDLYDAWRARRPIRAEEGVRLADGSRIVAANGGRSVHHVASNGRILDVRAFGPSCRVWPLRDGAGLHCWGDHLATTRDGVTWEVVQGPPVPSEDPSAGAAFALDGNGLAFARGCDGRTARVPPLRLCVRGADGRWRDVRPTLPPGEGAWSIEAMRANDLLLVRGGPRWAAAAVFLPGGETQPLSVAGAPAEPRYLTAALASDGAYQVSLGGEARAWSARMSPRAPWRVTPLPEGAMMGAWADDRRGLAFGARYRTYWRTTDGGAHWASLPRGVEDVGEAYHTPYVFDIFDLWRPALRCDAAGCVDVDDFVMRGWDAATPPGERILSGSASPPFSSNRPPFDLAPLRCARTTARAARRPSASDAPTGALGGFLDSHDLRAEAVDDGAGLMLSWQHAGRPVTARLPMRLDRASEVVLGLGAGALVAVDGGLEWVRGDVRRRLDLPPLERSQPGAKQWGVHPLPDGGFVVRSPSLPLPPHSEEDPDRRGHLHHALLFTVDADGTVASRRSISSHPPTSGGHMNGCARGVARVGDRWGSVLIRPDRSAFFTPLPGGPDAALGALPPALPPCATSPARDASVLWIESDQIPSAPPLGSSQRGRVGVDLRATGACVFALDRVGAWAEAARAPARAELHAEGGALVGHVDNPSRDPRSTAMRCAPP